jgi:hypothetical protein
MKQMAKIKLKASLGTRRNAQKADPYVDKACQAIGFAWDMWRMQAKFKNLKINGPTAIGTPGCLDGPAWEDLIKSQAPRSNAWERTLTNAIAGAFSEAWKKYQDSVTVPGLPWYPPFAAWPGPMAPPTPNIPTPFAALGQNTRSLAPDELKTKITGKAGKATEFAEQIAEALAFGFTNAFTIWMPTQQVMNVLGKGPVPTFAPPYVPVGPVIGGDNIAVPGHLAV